MLDTEKQFADEKSHIRVFEVPLPSNPRALTLPPKLKGFSLIFFKLGKTQKPF